MAPMWKFGHVVAKGPAIIAAVHIPRGTRILAEEPIVFGTLQCLGGNGNRDEFYNNHYYHSVSTITPENREKLHQLPCAWGSTDIAMKFRSNLRPHHQDSPGGGLFEIASHITHSCNPNAYDSWNTNLGCLTVHALRDIAVDEEITINFNPRPDMKYKERREHLKKCFNFICSCERCVVPSDIREVQDSVLVLFQTYCSGLRPKEIRPRHPFDLDETTRLKCVSSALNVLHQADLLGPDGRLDTVLLYMLCYSAYKDCAGAMNLSKAKVFLVKAHECRRVMEGDDGPEVIALKRAVDQLGNVEVPGGLAQTMANIEAAKFNFKFTDVSDVGTTRERDVVMGNAGLTNGSRPSAPLKKEKGS